MSLIVLAVVVGLVHAKSPSSTIFGGVNYRIGCLNPDSIPGFCVSYESCPGLKEVIPKYDPKFILQALSAHMCGFKEGSIYVCCPRSQQQTTTTTSAPTDEEIFALESRTQLTLTTMGTVDKSIFAEPWDSRRHASLQVQRVEDVNAGKCICPPRSTTVNQPTRAPAPATTTAQPPKIKTVQLLPKDCGIMASGGKPLKDHPWTVLLRLRLESGPTHFICAGVLISDRYVLTAAHCLKNHVFPKNAKIDEVRVGEYGQLSNEDCIKVNCGPPPRDIEVEESMVHPNFEPGKASQDDDVGLIRLKSPVKFNSYVRPICLPDGPDTYLRSDEFWSVGWGSGFSQKKHESVKSKANLRIVAPEDCAVIYNTLSANLTDNKICAGVENDDESCQGGSPLMTQNFVGSQFRWFIQGIFSITPTACGTPEKPSIFTKVYKYKYWIAANMRE